MLTLLPFTYEPGELTALFRRKQFDFMRWRFVLLGALMLFYAIRKRAFEDARQQDALRTLLQTKGLLKA